MKLTIRGLALLAMAVSLTATVAARADDQRLDGVTLRVATWGGSWRDTIQSLVGAEIERRGGKVEYVIGNPRDNLTKLINARGQPPPFDVMEVDDATRPFVEQGEFLAELDYTRLPNSRSLDASQRLPRTVGTWLTQHGIVYNTDKLREIGMDPPQRLTDLLDPRLQGRVAFPDINVGFVVNGIAGFAIEGGGNEADIEPGLDLIRKLKPSYYKSSVDLSAQFKSGDVWAAVWQAGWALRLHRASVPVAISFPRIGDKRGMAQLGWVGIVKNAREPKAAEVFINRYLDEKVQEQLVRATGVAAIHAVAADTLIKEDPVLRKFLILSPSETRNIFFVDWSKIDMSQWVDRWNRTMAR